MKEIDTIYEMQKKYGYIKSINLFREISGEECGKYNLELSLVNFPCWDIEEHLNIILQAWRVHRMWFRDLMRCAWDGTMTGLHGPEIW